MKYYIYYHINPVTNQPFYVGKGSGSRLYDWVRGRNISHKLFCAHLQSIGVKPKAVIIERFYSEIAAYRAEARHIMELKKKGIKLCNISKGGPKTLSGDGNPMFGRKRPDVTARNISKRGKTLTELYGEERAKEIKLKIKLRLLADKNPMYGKKRPDLSKQNQLTKGQSLEKIYGTEKAHEIRNKLRNATSGRNNPMYGRTGTKAPCYGRKGINHPMFGKHHSEETKSKISKNLKLSRGKTIIRSDGKKYLSLIDAAMDLGLKEQKEITKVLKGKRSHIKGYTFQYLNLSSQNL